MREAKALVPKLRFPEFRDSERWHKVSLSSLLTFQNGYPFTSSDFGEEKQGLRLIRNRDLRSEDRVVYYDGHPLPDFLVNNGDLLVGMDGDFTPCLWKKGTGLLNQRVGRIFPQGKHVLRFLGYLLEIRLKEVQEDTARTTVKHLSSRTVQRLFVEVPDPDEQQLIADCLGSLDDLITAEGRKLEALQQQKQGLMQQLFPRPGETVPKLRFTEFQDSGEWEPITLGQIGEFIGGGTPSTSIPEYWEGDIQWFTPSEINKRNLSKSKRTITDEGLKHSSAKLLPTGALLITTRATIGDVGIAEKPCATNQGFQSLVVFRHEVNVFWYYWFVSHKRELVRCASGSTFLEIGKTELKQISTLRPNKDEQKKIADCLGALDDLIAAQDQKIEALRQHKQGLMQQMFPDTYKESHHD